MMTIFAAMTGTAHLESASMEEARETDIEALNPAFLCLNCQLLESKYLLYLISYFGIRCLYTKKAHLFFYRSIYKFELK